MSGGVGGCSFVRAVVVYREVLLRSPLRTIGPAQRSEREWSREASAGKAKVGLRAPRLGGRLYRGRLCCFAIGFREEQAERKAGKGLHEVCLPSAGRGTEPEG